MENMELTTMEMEAMENENFDEAEVEGGSGKVAGLIIAGVAGVAAVGAVAYKKLKDKKVGKPKRKLKLFQWVEVEDEIVEAEIVEADEIQDDSDK